MISMRYLKKDKQYVFFDLKEIKISYLETEKLIDEGQISKQLWLFLINYLISYSYSQDHQVPYFMFMMQEKQQNSNKFTFQDLTSQLDQDQIRQDKIVAIYKIGSKFLSFIQSKGVVYVVNYCNVPKSTVDFLLNDFPGVQIKSTSKYITDDKSFYYFQHILLFIQGAKPESIQLTEFDDQYILPKLYWIVLKTGLSLREFQYEAQQQEEIDHREHDMIILKKKQMADQIRKLRKKEIEPVNNRVKLATPKNMEERKEQMQKLKTRIAYLKEMNGEPLEDQDVLDAEIYKQKYNNLNLQIDEELKQLDQIKQTQLILQTSNNKFLQNASNILQGKFYDQIFQGMGLQINNKSKTEILQQMKQKNFETISQPLIQNNNHAQIPGVFINVPREQIVAYRYKIQITKQMLRDYRQGYIHDDIINFYMGFLNELCRIYKVKSYFMKVESLLIRQSSEENYVVNYDKIYFPIRDQTSKEYSVGYIDTQQFKISHYLLYEQINFQPVGEQQKMMQLWQIDKNDPLGIKKERQQYQDMILKSIINWIRLQAQEFNLKNFHDMQLWTIRIQEVNTVQKINLTGLYSLVCLSYLAINQKNFDNPKKIKEQEQYIESLLVQIGVNQRNLPDFNLFYEFINR
ncbi:hypothetical protein pb186bvf_003291 [Paramecium bursaria]